MQEDGNDLQDGTVFQWPYNSTTTEEPRQITSELFIESVWESEESEQVTQIFLTTTSDSRHLLFCLFFKETQTIVMMLLKDTSTFTPFAKVTGVLAAVPVEAYSKSVSLTSESHVTY